MKGLKNIFAALRLTAQLDSLLLPVIVVITLCKNIAPYIDTLLGAWVLDGLILGKKLSEMLPVILGALILRLVLRAVSEFAEQIHWERDGLTHDLYLAKRSEKNLGMDHEKLNSPSVNALRDRMNRDDMYGWGLNDVVDYFEMFLGNLISMTAALIIVVPLLRFGGASLVYLAVTIAFIVPYASLHGWFVKKRQNLADSYEHSRSHSAYYLWGSGVDYKMGKDIRVFGAQPLIEKAIEEDKGEHEGRRRYARFCDKEGLFAGAFGGALQGSSYIYVVLSAIHGALSAGEVMKLAASLYSFWSSLGQLLTTAADMMQTANRLDNTLSFLALPEEKGGKSIPPSDGELYFEFRNVYFTYPGGKEALKNVSCEIRRGERLAIVGLNGSGKTTF